PVRGGIGGADRHRRPHGEGSGRHHAAGRRVQTAHFAVLVSGPGGGRPAAAGGGPGRDGPAGGHGGYGHRGRGAGGRIRGHAADRRPQHAKLPAAERGGDRNSVV